MEAAKTTKKVPLINKVAYALGTGGGNIFSQIAAAFLLQYYTDTALIGAGSIATMARQGFTVPGTFPPLFFDRSGIKFMISRTSLDMNPSTQYNRLKQNQIHD